MKDDPGYQLTVAVMATADAFMRESTGLFRPHGLTAAQYNVLNILAGAPAGMSQRELGDLLVVDRSNVTGLLDRLEKTGWVKRTDHPEDRRIYQISLTPSGRAIWALVTPLYLEAVAHLTRDLPVKRMRECVATLRQLEIKAVNWVRSAKKSAHPAAVTASSPAKSGARHRK